VLAILFSFCENTNFSKCPRTGGSVEERRRLVIGGAWTDPGGADVIAVISPHCEQPIASGAAAGPADVERAVSAARLAQDQGTWPRLDPSDVDLKAISSALRN
jgi:acyl-CoA reductase-like NAD-dependent aldehyde dehydrogenase